jgi:hypothetical protein
MSKQIEPESITSTDLVWVLDVKHHNYLSCTVSDQNIVVSTWTMNCFSSSNNYDNGKLILPRLLSRLYLLFSMVLPTDFDVFILCRVFLKHFVGLNFVSDVNLSRKPPAKKRLTNFSRRLFPKLKKTNE